MPREGKRFVSITAYEPDTERLASVCGTVLSQGSVPIVTDNSEIRPVRPEDLPGGTMLVQMGGNKGIAAALNAGIEKAKAEGGSCISFFDQDSDITEELLSALQGALDGERRITAPVSVDSETGEEYPSQRLSKRNLPKDVFLKDESQPAAVDVCITSGTTADISVFDETGTFDEDFFIDFVDIEWCVRCKKKGIKIWVVPGAVMAHRIGTRTKKFLFLNICMHSPQRTYYKVRNSFLIFKKKMGFLFSLRQLISAVFLNFFGCFGEKEWRSYFKYYYKGIGHGIIGRTGKIHEKKRKH